MDTTDLVEQVRATKDSCSWISEKAVVALVEADYGYLVSHEILSSTPVRSRYKGRFCATRHVKSLIGVVLDDDDVIHSVWFCPAAVIDYGYGTWTNDLDAGWKCSACIHTQDYSEIVQAQRYDTFLLAENVQTSERVYSIPSGERAQRVLKVLGSLGIASMEQLVQECSDVWAVGDAARKDAQTTSNTVYRLAKTGAIQKLGRGSKAVYSYT